MRITTIGDHMEAVLQEHMGSPALDRAARVWLDTDHNFTIWIHESAKKRLTEDEMLALVGAEEDYQREVNSAWQTYVATRNEAQESGLIAALEAMIYFRNRSMGRV